MKMTLSQRELEVLILVAEGQNNKQIAALLWLAPSTVKSHMERIAQKLGTGDRAGMVGAGFRGGLLT